MESNNLDNLIVVESLPKIKQQLQIISDEVDKEINLALSLECNEESKAEVKKARSRLNTIKSVMENKRKQVKQAILTPYEEFEAIYDNLVKNKLNEAENTLKMRISTIEEEQLKTKTDELIEFANEYFENYNLDFCKFEDIGLKVTLSASMKSLQQKILDFVNGIVKELMVIEKMPNRDEILYEYKTNGYNIGVAVDTVAKRIEAINMSKEKEEKQEYIEALEEENIKRVEEVIDELTPPVEIEAEEEKFFAKFTVKGTKKQLKDLKEYMEREGILYE